MTSPRVGMETTWIYYKMADDFAQSRNGDNMDLL